MKRIVLLSIILTFTQLNASIVSSGQARAVAENFINSRK